MQKKIFISYNHKDSEYVNIIDDFFKMKGFNLTRDIRDLKYTDNIEDFMKKIKEHDFFILFLSENYFKSINCMKELFLAINDTEFQKKVLPIVKEDSFYLEDTALEIYKYWEQEVKKFEEKLNGINPINAYSFFEEQNIRKNILINITKNTFELRKLLSVTFESEKKLNFKNILNKIDYKSHLLEDENLLSNLNIPNLKKITQEEKEEFIKNNFIKIEEIFNKIFKEIKNKFNNFNYNIYINQNDILIIEALVDNTLIKKMGFWIGGLFNNNLSISYKFLSNYEFDINKNSINGQINLKLNNNTKELELEDPFQYNERSTTIDGLIINIIKKFFIEELNNYSNRIRNLY